MKPKQIILLGIAALAVGLTAFESGRFVVAHRDWGQPAASDHLSSVAARQHGRDFDNFDLTGARISNFGVIGFEQAFDLLCDASLEVRQFWAARLEALPDGLQKRSAIAIFYKTLAQLDAAGAFNLAVSCVDQRTRVAALQAAMGATAASDMPKLAALFDRIPAKERRPLAHHIISRWTEIDPESTRDFVDQHLGDVDGFDLGTFLGGWAGRDPASACAWLETHKLNADDKPHAIRGLVNGWCDLELARAAEYVVDHQNDEDFRSAAEDVAWTLFNRAPDLARTFVSRLDNAANRNAAVSTIASLAAEIQTRQWQRPHATIAKWLVTLPEEAWAPAIDSVVAGWADSNQAEFFGWLNQLPRHQHDVVLSRYCAASYTEEVNDLFARAQTIDDLQLQDQALKALVERFSGQRNELIQALTSSGLSPVQKASLTAMIPAK